ncbi:MAG: MFS transporter, partial [Ilumatobacteraceae bacterium]
IGLGMGLTMTPSTEAITSSLPHDRQGVASALNDTSRELGGALGVALLGSVLNANYTTNVAAATEGLPAETAHTIQQGIGGAVAVAQQLGNTELVHAAREAFVDAWTQAMWAGVALVAVGWIFVALRGPKRVADVAPSTADTDVDTDTDTEPAIA